MLTPMLTVNKVVKIPSRDDLETRILDLLRENPLRPSELREKLLPPKKDKRVFDVELARALKKLQKKRSLRRDDRGHQKGVFYSLTENGRKQLARSSLVSMIDLMPPVEIQVLETLLHFIVGYVFIVAPAGTTLEGYLQLLRDKLNREETLKMARELQNDPRKLYAEFSEHLNKFRRNRLIAGR